MASRVGGAVKVVHHGHAPYHHHHHHHQQHPGHHHHHHHHPQHHHPQHHHAVRGGGGGGYDDPALSSVESSEHDSSSHNNKNNPHGNNNNNANNNNNSNNGNISDAREPDDRITRPSDHDVLLGRGGGTNNHSGNVKFRSLVNEHKMRYLACSKVDKPKVAREVVQLWRKMEPRGRFLARKDDTKRGPGSVKDSGNVWYDVGDKKAREKASQCLRERTPDVMPFMKQLREQQDAASEQSVARAQEQMSSAAAAAAALQRAAAKSKTTTTTTTAAAATTTTTAGRAGATAAAIASTATTSKLLQPPVSPVRSLPKPSSSSAPASPQPPPPQHHPHHQPRRPRVPVGYHSPHQNSMLTPAGMAAAAAAGGGGDLHPHSPGGVSPSEYPPPPAMGRRSSLPASSMPYLHHQHSSFSGPLSPAVASSSAAVSPSRGVPYVCRSVPQQRRTSCPGVHFGSAIQPPPLYHATSGGPSPDYWTRSTAGASGSPLEDDFGWNQDFAANPTEAEYHQHLLLMRQQQQQAHHHQQQQQHAHHMQQMQQLHLQRLQQERIHQHHQQREQQRAAAAAAASASAAAVLHSSPTKQRQDSAVATPYNRAVAAGYMPSSRAYPSSAANSEHEPLDPVEVGRGGSEPDDDDDPFATTPVQAPDEEPVPVFDDKKCDTGRAPSVAASSSLRMAARTPNRKGRGTSSRTTPKRTHSAIRDPTEDAPPEGAASSSSAAAESSKDPPGARGEERAPERSNSLIPLNGSLEDGELTLEEYRRQLEEYITNTTAGEPAAVPSAGDADGHEGGGGGADSLRGGVNNDEDWKLEDDWEKEKERAYGRGNNNGHGNNNNGGTAQQHHHHHHHHQAGNNSRRGVNRNVSNISGCSFMSAKTFKSQATGSVSLISGFSEMSTGTRDNNRSISSNISLMSELTDLSENIDGLSI